MALRASHYIKNMFRQDMNGENLSYSEEPYTIAQLMNEFHELDEMLAYKRSFEIVRAIAEKVLKA